MSNEKYRILDTSPRIPHGTNLEAVYDDYEGFRIILFSTSERQRYRVGFDDVFFYLVSDEGKRLRFAEKSMEKGGVIYKAETSEFLDWAFRENLGIVPKERWNHFLVCATDELIDVISPSLPNVITLP